MIHLERPSIRADAWVEHLMLRTPQGAKGKHGRERSNLQNRYRRVPWVGTDALPTGLSEIDDVT